MTEYLTEEEQVERLRAWWKEYGLALVAGVVLAIVLVVGWRYYQRYEARKTQAASIVYTGMMSASMVNQITPAKQAANLLLKKYKSTPYASAAALWLAKRDVLNQEYPAAIKQLQWITSNGDMDALKQVARIRIARIYLQLKTPNEALTVLQTVNDDAYQGLIAETKGDAYVQMGKLDKARTAYQKALVALSSAAKNQPILAMKLADLPAVKH